jgi:transcriptional regulator GlxA family with amidase domain
MRLKRAAQLLRQNSSTIIAEVAFTVGFSNPIILPNASGIVMGLAFSEYMHSGTAPKNTLL